MRALHLALALVGSSSMLIGCGGGGEPLDGNLGGSFKGEAFQADFGVAVEGDPELNPDGMFLVMGEGELDCENALERPPDGLYVVVDLLSVKPGTFTGAEGQVLVMKVEPQHLEAIGGTSNVKIDKVDGGRVTGSLTMDDSSNTKASGSFDVKRCF